jgi:DNA-binding LytR/AlgR family response regulator
MTKYTCIAVDDEPLALEQMKNYIAKVDSLELLNLYDNPVKALDFLSNNPVDIVFMDIEMDTLNGLQVIEMVNNNSCFILATAYDKYALKGFDLDVTDYLLKPIAFDRFLKAINRAIELIKGSDTESRISRPYMDDNKTYIFLKTRYHMEKVKLEDILYVKSLNNYLIVKTPKKSIFTLASFNQIQDLLPGSRFLRIHKSYVIPIDKVDAIGKKNVTIGETSIPISETYRQQFFEFLNKQKLI